MNTFIFFPISTELLNIQRRTIPHFNPEKEYIYQKPQLYFQDWSQKLVAQFIGTHSL